MTGWKTLIVAVLSFAAYTFAWPQLTEYLDAQLIAQIAAVLMFALRFLTSTSVGSKG